MAEKYNLSSQLRPLDIVRATVEGRVPHKLDDDQGLDGAYPALFAAVVHSEGGRNAGWCADVRSRSSTRAHNGQYTGIQNRGTSVARWLRAAEARARLPHPCRVHRPNIPTPESRDRHFTTADPSNRHPSRCALSNTLDCEAGADFAKIRPLPLTFMRAQSEYFHCSRRIRKTCLLPSLPVAR